MRNDLGGSPSLAGAGDVESGEHGVAERPVGPSDHPVSAARTGGAEFERLQRAYENPLLPRPVYLDARGVADVISDIAVVADVLLALPERLTDGDEAHFARQMGLSDERVALGSIGASRSSRHIGRADLIRTTDGFRMVELNLSSALGGFDIAALNRAFLTDDDVSRYVAENDIGYVDPVRQFVAYLQEATDGAPGTVGLVDTPTGFPKSRAHLELLAEVLAQHGVEAVPTHLGELEIGASISVRGRRIDTVHRFFTLGELVVDAATARWAARKLRQIEHTAVPVISPLSSSFFGSKRALASLWQPDVRAVMTVAEQAAVDRLVPWTAPITAAAESTATRDEFIERCAADRTRLVVKPAFGSSGRGVVVGWETHPDDWLETVTDLGRADYVVQEAVRPVTEQFPTESGNVSRGWRLNYGFFDLGGTFAGAYVRALPATGGAVIGESTGASRGCVFIAGDDHRLSGVQRPSPAREQGLDQQGKGES